ncbi:MAG: diaminopimelate decarboxylase [Alphaproteobacteria bacterium]|nr:diaminopimelate decarboxylase [Alphaproteobacteria bacterium]
MTMTGFHRINDHLCVDGIRLDAIAAEFGTPLYVYSAAAITANYQAMKAVFAGPNKQIHYAMKANSNLAILKLMQTLRAAVDIVSIGEFERALAAGFTPQQMVFSGVGKTRDELQQAMAADIGQINAESQAEVETIIALAKQNGQKPAVALRINPDIKAGGHAKISTGSSDTKFGIAGHLASDIYIQMAESGVIRPAGLAVHIGSQIMDCSGFIAAWKYMLQLADRLVADGYAVPGLDLGGGIGIDYATGETADLNAFGEAITSVFENRGYHLAIEPGRSMVAEAGCLISQVINVKTTEDKRFVIVDGAMNDLIRPTLYEAFHRITPLTSPPSTTLSNVLPADIVGPVCETGDYLGLKRDLPKVAANDLIAVMSAGAYGAAMRSNYNTRPMAAEVMVINGTPHRISKPQQISDLLAMDIIPTALDVV